MKKYLWIPAVAALAYLGKKGYDLKKLADQIQFQATGVRFRMESGKPVLKVFLNIQNPTPSDVKITKVSGSVQVSGNTIGAFEIPNLVLKSGWNKTSTDVYLDPSVLASYGLTSLFSVFQGGGFKLPEVTIKTNIHLGLISVSDKQTFKL